MPVSGIVAPAVLGMLGDLLPDLFPDSPSDLQRCYRPGFFTRSPSTWRPSNQPTRTAIGCSSSQWTKARQAVVGARPGRAKK